ncbi:hypothetical protein E2C01_015408 [Portunus trituberculatus]|uniref:Uncharacterized protein n=1 Tax=Portunus trituberculatus TaxID=210409 RepID=A0A5B7DMY6_PORTR|nr:hypothetical protein [Portunus trituberculatus]
MDDEGKMIDRCLFAHTPSQAPPPPPPSLPLPCLRLFKEMKHTFSLAVFSNKWTDWRCSPCVPLTHDGYYRPTSTSCASTFPAAPPNTLPIDTKLLSAS